MLTKLVRNKASPYHSNDCLLSVTIA